MGLLDSLLASSQGGGLLGGLPASWQWQNPADRDNSTQDFLSALQKQPYAAIGGAAPANPLGLVPQLGPPPAPQAPGVFATGTAGLAGGRSGPVPGMFAPQMTQAGPQLPGNAASTLPPPVIVPAAPVDARPAAVSPNTPGPDPLLFAQAPQLPPALGGPPAGLLDRLSAKHSDPRSIQQQDLNAQFQAVRRALLQDGMSPQEAASKAMFDVLNPAAEKPLLIDALKGRPVGAGDEAPGVQIDKGVLANGVKQADGLLQEQVNLQQFPPAVQRAVRDSIDGKSLPMGGIAQRYGSDTGQPVKGDGLAAAAAPLAPGQSTGATNAPASEGSSLSGVAKSLGVGAAQSATRVTGLIPDISATMKNVANEYLFDPLLNATIGKPSIPESEKPLDLDKVLGSDGLQKAIEGVTGNFYKPKGTAEEIANKVGQYAAGGIAGPEALATRLAARVGAPAAASLIARKLTEGTSAEPVAELAAGFGAGIGATAAANGFRTMAAARAAALPGKAVTAQPKAK
jgi:hypothetical protein